MKNKMEADLIIFDWSGTISDDRKPVYNAINSMLSSLNLNSLTFEEFIESYRSSLGTFIRENGLEMSDLDALELYRKNYQEVIDSGIRPQIYPQALEVIPRLKERNKKLSVLSSHPFENLLEEAEIYGLSMYFDFIEGSSIIKSEGIKDILKKMRHDPKKTVYIGDVTFDITAAKNAGVKPIGISTGYHSHRKLTLEFPNELIIRNLEELEKLIQ